MPEPIPPQSPLYKGGRSAFTLAEVLITLGIIGVVAAMTLPAIIHKKQTKELEVSFKKAYANLSNAFNMVIADEFPVFDESLPGGDISTLTPFAKELYSKYKKLRQTTGKERTDYNNSLKNLSKKAPIGNVQCSQGASSSQTFIANDGTVISAVQNCGALWITIDTNGLKKGPNAYGHDIFIFYAPKNTKKLLPGNWESEIVCDENNENCNNNTTGHEKCSNSSTSTINGVTCAVFAVKNECPWDSAKTYWECLP